MICTRSAHVTAELPREATATRTAPNAELDVGSMLAVHRASVKQQRTLVKESNVDKHQCHTGISQTMQKSPSSTIHDA